ncbi:hypothetical protein SAMN05216436_102122 [bacterium A37T11]|nr:hypothetical protein SAMN05216436_102122 [bacterium A37T11]
MSKPPPNHPLLDRPIQELDVSEEFILRSKLLGFKTIREITKYPKGKLYRHKDFSYGWVNELLGLLQPYDLLYLMDD